MMSGPLICIFFVEQLNENARLGTEMPIVYFI